MKLDELLAHADTEPARAHVDVGLCGEFDRRVEERSQRTRRKTGPRIGDAERDERALDVRAHNDLARSGVANGVAEQVHEHLLNAQFVRKERG